MKHCSILLLLVALYSCERVKYFPNNPIVVDKTRFLAHRGGGNFDEGNTIEACKYGLSKLDGVECDLQKSLDNDIWLCHSSLLPSCGSFNSTCFASVTSNTINLIDSCLGNGKDFTQLETVFQYMENNYPDKYISLDVKAWNPCDISGMNIIKEMNELGQEIIRLTNKYHLENRVLVESETGDFLYYIKTHSSGIETYLTTLGDFELGVSRALDAGFSGISFEYYYRSVSKELIDLIHRKGLKIQLWTVNDHINEALLLNPDFIQTDSLDINLSNP